MITKSQIEKLAQFFKIDQFTIFREYLQILFLNNLYKEIKAEKIYFKGGTCLHLFFGSPRFSEDLDFSTLLSEKTINDLIKRVEKSLKFEIPEIEINFLWKGKNGIRYKLKYQGKEFKYPLSIRIDFAFEKILLKPIISQIATKFPIGSPSLILHLDSKEMLTEKIRAFLWRAKGRDIYDLWYLLKQKTSLDEKILKEKMKRTKGRFKKEAFLKKINNYPQRKIYLDLAKFLPEHHRKITLALKTQLIFLLK